MSSRASGEPASEPASGERQIVDHILRRLPPPPASLIVAAGDDAAVVAPERGALQVLTTDALVEGVHFDRRFSTLHDVGYKAIAVNASDIAAMGGASSLALLSLILPDTTSIADVDALLDGALEMAAAAKLHVAGGNVSRSPGPLIVDVTVTGHVRPRRILTRGGGRAGESLYVTGTIGAAAAGLAWLQSPAATREPDASIAECVQRHRRPEPRLRIGALAGRTHTASAAIDLSDGLADGVRRIAEASATGAVIDAGALPIHAGARAWFESAGADPVIAALSGGDDFELLFSVRRKSGGRLRALVSAARGVPITKIGELTSDPGVWLVRAGVREPMPAGYEHFAPRP